jgi:UDPglucose--hexose-1-phosphate uridylyltransferase
VSDFKFIEIPNGGQWVVSAPKRARRPESKKKTGCVFCPKEDPNDIEIEKYRIGGEKGDPNWKIRVIQNKFPFAPIHDVVILTPEHVKHISDVNVEQVRLGIETYVNRYNTYKKDGNVTIFGNARR